jgi:hypothetical protein
LEEKIRRNLYFSLIILSAGSLLNNSHEDHRRLRVFTVKEAQVALLSLLPVASRETIMLHNPAIDVADESNSYFMSSWYGTTTYAMDIHRARLCHLRTVII